VRPQQAERQRAADLAAEEKRAEHGSAAKAREVAEAKARELEGGRRNWKRARAEQARLDAEARRRAAAEAREQQARIDRATAEHAAASWSASGSWPRPKPSTVNGQGRGGS
jgi:hypothetical protein